MIIAEDAPIRVLIRNHLDFKGKVSRKRYLHFRLFSILPICLIIWLQHLASQGGPQALEYTIASCLIALLLIPVDFSYMIRRATTTWENPAGTASSTSWPAISGSPPWPSKSSSAGKRK